MSEFLNAPAFPYCKGCGHHLIARNTVRALELMDVSPLDVVLVTDIGCHGIVDRVFTTHTVHGLHGRSVALGAGIAMGLSSKPVIVFQGDGGATIGLQHLLEAARLNVNMTLVLHNNMLYGMTGGQPSGLTPCGFCTIIEPDGCTSQSYDMCKLTHDAGAAYVSRVLGQGDFSASIKEAIETVGFSLIEVLELCPSYGIKLNPDLRLKELAKQAGYEPGLWTNETRPAFQTCERFDTGSLLDGERIEVRASSPLERRTTMVLGGSAGEGVQLAAEILAKTAMTSGLQATKKGIYPVTVGVGFSTAEIILSRRAILSYDIPQPDAVIITSADGLKHNLERIREMKQGTVWLDKGLEPPETGAEVRVRDFREKAGARNAILYAVLVFACETGVVPSEALAETLQRGPASRHFPAKLLEGGSD
jgi:pyruvate/2-oxoacid:ferredoxin oxidoreductase beta subunit